MTKKLICHIFLPFLFKMVIPEKYKELHFIVVLTFIFSFVWTDILMRLQPFYVYFGDIISSNDYMVGVFLGMNIINNIYQVYAHLFVGTKFLGFRQVVPYGSDEKQSLMEFTISNIFDILGWMTIYIYYGSAPLPFAAIGAFHFSSGMISMFFNKTFHKYFIGPPDTEEFKGFYWTCWKTVRSVFVFTDAGARGYLTYIMVFS